MGRLLQRLPWMRLKGAWKNRREWWTPDPANSCRTGRDSGALLELRSLPSWECLGRAGDSDYCLPWGFCLPERVRLHLQIPFSWASRFWLVRDLSDRVHGISQFHQIQFSAPVVL